MQQNGYSTPPGAGPQPSNGAKKPGGFSSTPATNKDYIDFEEVKD